MRRLCAGLVLGILAAGIASGTVLGQSEKPADPRPVPGDWAAVLGDSYGLTRQDTYFYVGTPRVIIYRDGRAVWREEDVKAPANPWREGRIDPARLTEAVALARRNGFFSSWSNARISQRTLPSDMPGDYVGLADGDRTRTIETYALVFLAPQPVADGLTRATAEVSGKIETLLPRPGSEHHPDRIRVGRFPSSVPIERAVDWPVHSLPVPPPRNDGHSYGEIVYSGEAADTTRRVLSQSSTFKVGDEVFNAYWCPAIGMPETNLRMPDFGPIPSKAGPALRTFAGHKDAVTSVAWSPSGKFLATSSPGGEDQPRIWNLRTGRLETMIERLAELVAWRPQGEALAASKGGSCFLFQSPWKVARDIAEVRG